MKAASFYPPSSIPTAFYPFYSPSLMPQTWKEQNWEDTPLALSEYGLLFQNLRQAFEEGPV